SFGKIELAKIIFLKPNSAPHNLYKYLQELSRDTYFMSRGHGTSTSTYPQHRRLKCSPNAPRIAQGSVYPGQDLSQTSAGPLIKPMIQLSAFLLKPNPSELPHILVARRYCSQFQLKFVVGNALDLILCQRHVQPLQCTPGGLAVYQSTRSA